MSGRVAVLFSGGPAPAANAVIASAVSTLRRAGHEVVGIRHGYRALAAYDPQTAPLVEGRDWFLFADRDLWGLRHQGGVVLGTSRTSPGRAVQAADDLDDTEATCELRRVLEGLHALGCDALVSIGGDGTLMTANRLHRVQAADPSMPRVRIVHVPKTIDNDYGGIDFTFGFFTAVDVYARALRDLREDARATERYYVADVMGRASGWLPYAASIAGEAHLVVAVEDVVGRLARTDDAGRVHLDVDALVDHVCDLVVARAAKGKTYGVVVLAEGLVGLMAPERLEDLPRGEHGEPSLAALQLGRFVAARVEARLEAREGLHKRVVGVQLGYEARCAEPHAFDMLLGSQLGVGAARAVLDGVSAGVMVSIEGQLSLRFVPFADLVDPVTLRTETRFVPRGSDFHRLARGLATQVPGRDATDDDA